MENGSHLLEEREDRILLFFDRKIRQGDSGCGEFRSHGIGEHGSRLVVKVGDFINEAPFEGVLGREPAADFHQVEQALRFLLALPGIHRGDVHVELVKVGGSLFAVGDKGAELVGIEASPFKERSRTLVDEVHGVLVNGDMSRTERSDSCGGSIHADEVNADLAVVLESSGNGESGGKVATERVNQHVHFLAGILGEDIIDIIAVKVGTADEAFQVKIVLSLRHNTFCFATKLPIL